MHALPTTTSGYRNIEISFLILTYIYRNFDIFFNININLWKYLHFSNLDTRLSKYSQIQQLQPEPAQAQPHRPNPTGGGRGTITMARGVGGAGRTWDIYIYIFLK